MTLDEIIAAWAKDSIIDSKNLDTTAIRSATLHAKYLELYSVSKLQLKKQDWTMAVLRKDKWLYYNGKMSKEDMDKFGWSYDPFKGLAKPLKSEMDMFYETDPDIAKLKIQMDYQTTVVEALKEIMDTIKWRHSTIKTILDAQKFMAGC